MYMYHLLLIARPEPANVMVSAASTTHIGRPEVRTCENSEKALSQR